MNKSLTATRSVLVIDNYDSFTYNLVHYLRQLTDKVEVVRNDAISLKAIEAKAPSHILLSPGPCTPNEAGISLPLVSNLAGKFPILGVCLGHQTIAQAFGAKIVKAAKIMHGKTSRILHSGEGLFKGMPCPLQVTRYHSLVVDPATLPASFRITAWLREADQTTIMGIQHKNLPLYGVQFHPESVLSEAGIPLLRNFLLRH